MHTKGFKLGIYSSPGAKTYAGNEGSLGQEPTRRARFSLWAMMAAPLIAGSDVAAMSDDAHSMLTHKDAIAIDPDALGKQGDCIYADGQKEVRTRRLAMAMAILP